MEAAQGIHHITAFASDPQRNVNFYQRVLGQRLVKTTVNFDDPGTYHLYYGDEIGTPGTIMTFFPWPMARRGVVGNGEVAVTSYAIPPGSVAFWRERLAKHGVIIGETETVFGAVTIPFQDPDGLTLALVASDTPGQIRHWEAGPVPAEHAIQGFYGATIWVERAAATADVLTMSLGFTMIGQEENRTRFRGASSDTGLFIDLVERPGQPRGQMGAGSVHHIAFRTRDDAEQIEYQHALGAAGLRVTPVQDRQYFHSIYFRVASGVLFEIATDAPGFLYDEDFAVLGRQLRLPTWLEPQRQQIEQALPPLDLTVGGPS